MIVAAGGYAKKLFFNFWHPKNLVDFYDITMGKYNGWKGGKELGLFQQGGSVWLSQK